MTNPNIKPVEMQISNIDKRRQSKSRDILNLLALAESRKSEQAKYVAGESCQTHFLFPACSNNLLHEERGEPRGLPDMQAFLRHAQGVIHAPSQQWAIRLSINRLSCIVLTTSLIEIASTAIYGKKPKKPRLHILFG